MEAIKLGLTGKIQLEDNGNEYDVVVEGDFNEMITTLQKIDSFEEIPCPRSFNGELRHYQEVGLTWMGNMTKYNFGLCLADDMGLGKTIQIIAFLLYLKKRFPNNPGSVLIICPTSVLFNWHRELNKFAPDLEVVLHHGAKRGKDASKIPEFLKPHRIYLTSYGTIRNDIDFLETINFSGVIIDESQNMKNYASKQTKAINRLQSQYRICLSGTPIENRLLELWSLFNFLNPGLLGSKKEFQEKYTIPIERFQNKDAIENLKLIISPFILRRVKTDKKIINDLPKKNEIKLYLELNEEQIKFYQELVENTLKEIDQPSLDKKRKSGLILGLLVKLKQICNHPYQYLKIKLSQIKKEEELKEIISLSPKLERLVEMTEEVVSNGEKVLIFTQFTQMGTILHDTLEYKHKFKILYLHGGVPEKKRRVIVDEFQSKDITSPSILILSLKAGGTGLNLTQGTTVIHFDRWWNPAVEDQATDRAYRIGQKSVVNVFKFIMHGTIEEKIDVLLEEKRELANKIVSSTGESWISDLNTEKLRELLVLNN
ncbi:MAG TPA: DEAD/DEAH box helicase [archaeon]|nr:DEAD/DEAH box helicase [archaeon]